MLFSETAAVYPIKTLLVLIGNKTSLECLLILLKAGLNYMLYLVHHPVSSHYECLFVSLPLSLSLPVTLLRRARVCMGVSLCTVCCYGEWRGNDLPLGLFASLSCVHIDSLTLNTHRRAAHHGRAMDHMWSVYVREVERDRERKTNCE